MSHKGSWNHQPLPDRVRLVVEVARPSSDELASFDRATRVRKLQENAKHRRADLVRWLTENHLSNQVSHVARSTLFNILFLDATREVAQKLKDAPGVLNVSVLENVEVMPLEYEEDET